ncbi:15-hydroxyprostaglandin dehydrogenase [NAD(+)]-like [Aricia agestis]|uniref:15-hydroxyprostaglandin dehydrogenase [NAD(+)]-like n=1 Tax=Aricia agestis TaxID=91739 RepID=UPI001C204C55|nr:15-hydroxyprostaglandin dehydrogenase [NAD(+)]-like [Aricia agestis]
MAKDLKNKVVVITGGAVGIGKSIADNFLKKGAKTVVILDVNEKRGIEAAANLNSNYGSNKAVFMRCDVTKDLDKVSEKIISTFKTVDILVNNAGTLNELNTRRTIDLNVLALIDWSLRFWEHMRIDKNGKGGTIINIASIYGFRYVPYLPVYQASKFAVMGFTRSLGHSQNFERSGVRVVAVCPGFTRTELIAEPVLWDDVLKGDFSEFLTTQLWQEVEDVGKAAVGIFEKATSGSAWLIEEGKPIVEVN